MHPFKYLHQQLGLLKSDVMHTRCFERLPDTDNAPSNECIVFQRATVIFFDIIYIFGAIFASSRMATRNFSSSKSSSSLNFTNKQIQAYSITAVLLILNPGLLLLDHIHFQYNAMMLGLLLASITCINSKSFISGAILYCVLLTFKHLYLMLAPLYFVYLLRAYCFVEQENSKVPLFSLSKFIRLGVATVVTLLIPFVPVLANDPAGQLKQILARLFPFARGLCHDYWAGNVWALYLFSEKVLSFVGMKFHVAMLAEGLPEVPPNICAIILLISIAPALVHTWNYAGSNRLDSCRNLFINAVVSYCLRKFYDFVS